MVQFQTVLMDSDKLLREGLRRLLEGSEFAPAGEASTIDEASQALRDVGGELFLFDFCAGSDEDFEFLRKIRTEHEGIKTVVLTNRITGALLAKALDAGADGYLLRGLMELEIGVEGERDKLRLEPGEGLRITPGTRHRMMALEDCDILEVSTPELDDVVRLEDRYGRVGRKND